MGVGRIARGLGKVGLLIEGLTYAWSAGRALVRAVRRSEERPHRHDDAGDDADADDQHRDDREDGAAA